MPRSRPAGSSSATRFVSAFRSRPSRNNAPLDYTGRMLRLAAGVSYCDLQFQSRPRIVAAALLHGAGGAAIVDPGPSSTLPVLHAALAASGLSMGDVTALLLTHIHLDHAG